ncbi:hypothetical protein NL676_006195 [Syzygium grande]|nr:hypothetical protein NL676_006195 [Syzygium grande]
MGGLSSLTQHRRFEAKCGTWKRPKVLPTRLHSSRLKSHLALSTWRLNTVSKSGGLKNSLTPLSMWQVEEGGLLFRGAGGHGSFSGILASLAVGVVDRAASAPSPSPSPPPPSLGLAALVLIGFIALTATPGMTHSPTASGSNGLPSACGFFETPISAAEARSSAPPPPGTDTKSRALPRPSGSRATGERRAERKDIFVRRGRNWTRGGRRRILSRGRKTNSRKDELFDNEGTMILLSGPARGDCCAKLRPGRFPGGGLAWAGPVRREGEAGASGARCVPVRLPGGHGRGGPIRGRRARAGAVRRPGDGW